MVVLEEKGQWETAAAALDTFRGTLRFGTDTRPAWHLLVLIGCVAFFTDVLNRRLHWSPGHAFRGARASHPEKTTEPLTLERLGRLKQRKSTAREFARGSFQDSAEPFAPPLPGERPLSDKRPLSPVATTPEQAESYTERLLRAKQEAKRSTGGRS